MTDFFQIVQTNAAPILLLMAFMLLFLLVAQIILFRRFKDVSRRYKLLTRGPSGADLEQILQQYAGDVAKLEQREEELRQEQEKQKEQVAECVHNLGLIRFNAFDNMGSDLSFSLAMLDRRGDGVVLTGLYGRDETRVYAKPVRKGTSDYSLTAEEVKAVQSSLEKN